MCANNFTFLCVPSHQTAGFQLFLPFCASWKPLMKGSWPILMTMEELEQQLCKYMVCCTKTYILSTFSLFSPWLDTVQCNAGFGGWKAHDGGFKLRSETPAVLQKHMDGWAGVWVHLMPLLLYDIEETSAWPVQLQGPQSLVEIGRPTEASKVGSPQGAAAPSSLHQAPWKTSVLLALKLPRGSPLSSLQLTGAPCFGDGKKKPCIS